MITRRCGMDNIGRSACAELIRHQLRLEANVLISTVIPDDPDACRGYRCVHGIAYWVPREDTADAT